MRIQKQVRLISGEKIWGFLSDCFYSLGKFETNSCAMGEGGVELWDI